MIIMSFFTNRYVPIYCGKSLRWFERTYDFIDLNRWEDFQKNRDQYTENAHICSFDEFYKSIGFKPVNNSLEHLEN